MEVRTGLHQRPFPEVTAEQAEREADTVVIAPLVTHASPRLTIALVLALLVAAYAPFLGGGFLTDDFVHVTRLEDASSVADVIAAPDAFGFFRPLTQFSLATDAALFGRHAVGYRVTNLALHAGVLAMAGVVAGMVLSSEVAAAAAVLAFALTPKAHPIAVLWISARGDLLMALFSLASVASWMRWTRGGGTRWLAVSVGCYVLAWLSKETAALVPLLLVLSPGASRPLSTRIRAVVLFIGCAFLLLWWRASVGALMPLSSGGHYELAAPAVRFARNAWNYAARMIPAPLMLILVAGVVACLARRRGERTPRESWHAAVFGVAWIALLLAPVLGIVMRSEVYLYLPTFGGCLCAAWIASPWLDRLMLARHRVVTIAATVIALAAYQVSRTVALHGDLVFSERLVSALSRESGEDGPERRLALDATDAGTARYLEDAIGGYADVVARFAGTRAGALRFRCTYARGRVLLEPF